MHQINLVCRSASSEAIDLIESRLHEAGYETRLFVFGGDDDRNAMVAVELAEAHMQIPETPEVWVVPSAFAAIEQEHHADAAEARAQVGLPHPPRKASRRLLVMLDDGPDDANRASWLRLSDLTSGRVGPQMIREKLLELQKVTGPNPSS